MEKISHDEEVVFMAGKNKLIDKGVNAVANMPGGALKSYLTGAWLPGGEKSTKKRKKNKAAQQARTGLNKGKGMDLKKDRTSGAEKKVFGEGYKRKNWGRYGN